MGKLNFRIVEGSSNDLDWEEFKEDYMNPYISKKSILDKYGIGGGKYLRLGNQVYKETGFKRSCGVRSIGESTNISKRGNRYRIDKYIKGNKTYCGTYESFEVAKEVRDFLVANDWDLELVKQCIVNEGVL